jgi:ribonuclease P protein component
MRIILKLKHSQKGYCDYETDISAPQHPQEKNSWLSCADENQKRPENHQCTPRQRKKKIGRLNRFGQITRQSDFDIIYRRPDKTWHTPWFVVFYRRSPECRAAFVAGKKVGNAVRRNRAKRLLRAHFLNTVSNIENGSYILIAKAGILKAPFSEVESGWLKALRKCRLLSDKNGIPDCETKTVVGGKQG